MLPLMIFNAALVLIVVVAILAAGWAIAHNARWR